LVHGMVSSLESLQIRRNHRPAKAAHPFPVRLSGGKNEVMFCSSSIGSYLGLFVLGIRSNAVDHFKGSASEGGPSYEKNQSCTMAATADLRRCRASPATSPGH
jgi:hypothetical protein